MDFATFLDYHGTTIADSLLAHYIDLFDHFCQFQFDNPYVGSVDKAFIKWKREYQPTSTLNVSHLDKMPMFPYPSIASNNIPPVIVSATSTTTTALINENNQKTEQAVNQLMADYLDDDIHQLLNIEPILNSINSPTSSTSSASISPPPELTSFPPDHTDIFSPQPQPTPSPPPPPPISPEPPATPVARKDISLMKKQETGKKKKRKRVANISPQQQQPPAKKNGRPSMNATLTKLANNEFDNNQISTQNLILRALDGSEKKKKTILTCSTESIELYNLKQFSCYEFLGDLRKKVLDTIKEQKYMLEHILYIEKMVTQNIERKKTKKKPHVNILNAYCKTNIFFLKPYNDVIFITKSHPFTPYYP
jgi:hypothetical protein